MTSASSKKTMENVRKQKESHANFSSGANQLALEGNQ